MAETEMLFLNCDKEFELHVHCSWLSLAVTLLISTFMKSMFQTEWKNFNLTFSCI